MNKKNQSDTPWTDLQSWETRFLNQDTPWDQGHPSPSLRKLFDIYPLLESEKTLVPGCGVGHEVLLLAEKNIPATALDGSQTALNLLADQAKRLQLDSQIRIVREDFWKHSPPQPYDVIVEHTFFCAIDPSQRKDFVSKIQELLEERGKYYGVFLISDETVDSPPFYTTQKEVKALFEPAFQFHVFERSPVSEYPWGSKQFWAYFTRK